MVSRAAGIGIERAIIPALVSWLGRTWPRRGFPRPREREKRDGMRRAGTRRAPSRRMSSSAGGPESFRTSGGEPDA